MQINNRKDLKRIWDLIAPDLKLPKNVTITDIEFSIGYNRTTYISLDLNNTTVFFIFDTDGPYIQLFSHEQIPKDLTEVAAQVKNYMTQLIYYKQSKQAKASKSD